MAKQRFTTEEIIHKLRKAKVVIEQWRQHYNRVRPQSALCHRPPAPATLARKLTMERRIGRAQRAA
jgi:putative transposase